MSEQIKPARLFDPAAQCPRWEAFLNKAVGVDVAARLQSIIGNMIDPTAPRQLICIYGPQCSGKTTFLSTISYILCGREYDPTAQFTFYATGNQPHILIESLRPSKVPSVINIGFNPPTDYDRNLPDDLRRESAGILNWILKGQ